MLIYLAKKKEILKCTLSIKALIIEGKWQEVKSGLGKLVSLYHRLNTTVKIDNSCLLWPEMVTNLSNILNSSLIYNAPYGIVKKILEIDPEISSILVSIPFSSNADRSLRGNGGSFLRWRGRFCAALPNPPDTSDLVDMLPVEIACKKGTQADIIRCLLLNDKNKITYMCKVGLIERNLLYYATICALCRYRHNSQNEARKKITCLPSHTFFQEYTNLIKFLCMKSPTLLMFRDFDSENYSALEVAGIIRLKIKEDRKHKLLFFNEEDETYCKRVEHIYQILKRAYQKYKHKCGLASTREDDDLQTEYAQCEGSTMEDFELIF